MDHRDLRGTGRGTTLAQPRHFHANERFFIEATFEAPLPEGGYPLAEFAGPLGPGGPALTFWSSASAEVVENDRTRMRLVGKIPSEAPPGLYRVTHLEVQWSPEMPLSWEAVVVPLAHLGGDIVIEVDLAALPSQPAIPRLLSAG